MLMLTTSYTSAFRKCLLISRWAVPIVLAACRSSDAAPQSQAPSTPPSRLAIATNLHTRLVENSIAVTSVSQPGIIFGANDSGHDALLFAFDSTGVSRGVWRVTGARNLDWEAASLGPCGGTVGAQPCIYIGDVGDNEGRKPAVTVYRIPEPTVTTTPSDPRGAPATNLPRAEALSIAYPDSPHDVEAMYVNAAGDLFLITKRRLLDAARRPRPALVYRVPASAWGSSGSAIAALVDSLPIIPGSGLGRQVTDAALSPDGKLLAIRTYTEVYIFPVEPASSRPASGSQASVCPILDLNEKQGEGIGWWWDSRRVLLTSEGRNQPLHVIACSLPKS